MSMRTLFMLLVLSSSLVGCFNSSDPDTPVTRDGLLASGKPDTAIVCPAEWLGDGAWCDCFCSEADPDCDEGLPEFLECDPAECRDADDPDVRYVGTPTQCLVIDFGCTDGWSHFEDDCGCGCERDNPVECPDADDPSVHYVGGSETNPEACETLLFTCGEDQTPFYDSCGCGCIDNPLECPDPEDPSVHYVGGSETDPSACATILFMCEEGQTVFSNACGCGCIDAEPPSECRDPEDVNVRYEGNPAQCEVIDFACADGWSDFSDACGCGCEREEPLECPDPADERVHYVGNSDEEPTTCYVIFFGCEEDQTLFSNECGCGCIDS